MNIGESSEFVLLFRFARRNSNILAKSMNVSIDRIRHAHKHTSGTGRHRNAAALFFLLHVLVARIDQLNAFDALIAPVCRAAVRHRKTPA